MSMNFVLHHLQTDPRLAIGDLMPFVAVDPCWIGQSVDQLALTGHSSDLVEYLFAPVDRLPAIGYSSVLVECLFETIGHLTALIEQLVQ
jgi:hypothetical protein